MIATRFRQSGRRLAAVWVLLGVVGGNFAWAQGFGPDPFRPYNNQYDAFTYPIGPPAADAAASAAMMRSGLRGANQFQNYLSEIQGLGRAGTERYGQGLPYYRSVFDPRFDPNQRREYRPNSRTDASFEKVQQQLTAKYLAYFDEKDPKKRAQLLRDYQTLRRRTSRALSARRESPERLRETLTRTELGDTARSPVNGQDGEARNRTPRSPLRSRSSETAAPSGPRSTAPPPMPPRRSTRSPSPADGSRTPSEVLDRARRMESLRGTGRSTRRSVLDQDDDSGLRPDRRTPND
jgi:hypothetical protein